MNNAISNQKTYQRTRYDSKCFNNYPNNVLPLKTCIIPNPNVKSKPQTPTAPYFLQRVIRNNQNASIVLQIQAKRTNLQSFFRQRMQSQLQIEPVYSLVPVKDLQTSYTLARKYWHIIAKADFIVPYGLYSLKITLILIYFERSLFLTVLFEVLPMLPAPVENLESPNLLKLTDYQQWPSIPLHYGSIPLGCGIIELPYYAECFSSVSCNMHSSKAQ